MKCGLRIADCGLKRRTPAPLTLNRSSPPIRNPKSEIRTLATIRNLFFLVLFGCSTSLTNTITILNVSYDPTRELYRDLNKAFAEHYFATAGVKVAVKQSHGGSSSQARAILDGLPADVATLATWFDIDALRKDGLVASDWEKRLPNRALPYYSTIVFVVRKGNPKQIRDWPDLVRPDVKVITPNPKTGGNGKLSFLAAWGSVIVAGKSTEEAKDFVTRLYRNVPVLDTGARAATATFAQKKIGDVHLTWENEAHLEVAESKGDLEIVFPSRSIRAEPHVALVDATVDRRGTRAVADAYLRYLYSPEAQELIAKRNYRPSDAEVFKRHASQFPSMELFPLERIAKDWNDAQSRFFADDGVFDRIYSR